MPRDGSGTYTRAVSSYVNGTVANATTVNTEMDDIASALTGSLPVNGVKAMAANLPMGGFKLTGLAAGTTNGDSVRYEQLTALSGTYQPLDATLTALAALATSADQYIYATGSDTFALATVTSAARTLLADASVPRLGVGNTFSAAAPQVFNHTSTSLQVQMNLAGTLRGYLGADATYSLLTYNAVATNIMRQTHATGLTEFLFNVDVVGASSSLRARTRPLTTTTGTLVAADANCAGTLTGGVTLPNSVFSAGDMQVFDAGTSARTLTRGAGIQMFLNGTDVASATLAANQTCGVFWRSASVAVLSGGVS